MCASVPLRRIWGSQMRKPHPIELRVRVVAYVDEGHGHREAARHFRVSPKFGNELVKLRRETGSLAPRQQGNGGGHGKLAGRPTGSRPASLPGGDHAHRIGQGVFADAWYRRPPRHGLAGSSRSRADTQENTFKRLNNSAGMWLTCYAYGLQNVSPSWPGIWKDWRSSTRPRSRPTWPG